MPHIFLTVLCDLSPRSFFPGRSFFFWLLIAMGFYLAYLYNSSKNKKDFIRSPYILSVSVALCLFFSTFLFINLFLNEPPSLYAKVDKPKDVLSPIKEEQNLLVEVEKNFTDIELHHQLVHNHFQIPLSLKTEYGDVTVRDDHSILNFYLDKLESMSDPFYLDHARFGIAIVFFYKDSLQRAHNYLKDINSLHNPLLDLYNGKIYLAQKDTLKAIASFKTASQVKGVYQEESTENLIHLLSDRNENDELYKLFNQEYYKPFFSIELSEKLYFLNNRIGDYYYLKVVRAFRNFKWAGFVAALVILITWGVFIVRMDIFEKENKLIMLIVLLMGMGFSLGCFYLYDFLHYKLDFYMHRQNLFVYCIFGIGLVEEFVKVIPLILLLLLGRGIINEPYDYILYAALSALGFSFMENLMYFDGDLNNVVHGRALTSVPGHIIMSSIVAYGFILAKYRYPPAISILVIAAFFFLGVVNHGLYDYWLFADFNVLFIVGFILSVSFWIIMINNSLNNSPSFNYQVASQSDSRQLILSFSLLGILIMEYIMVAWERGPLYANANFNGNLFFGGIMITYYSSRLNNIDLVKGYWGGIPFKTIKEKRADSEFDMRNFLIRIISGDTFTHSFVNHEIILLTRPENEKLYSYFNTSVKGIINDRLVVSCKSSKGKIYEDPFWFRLELINPIDVGGGMEQTFLFRFEDTRPSFEESSNLTIYLFALKSKNDLHEKISRENLRALGKAFVRR